MSGDVLPLFPLTVVLFPGASLPLHIFEERYKTLIGECIGKEKEFGINLVRGDEIVPVGCTARVSRVLQRYEDGKLDIIVQGLRRYDLERVESGHAPYLVGWVNFRETAGDPPDTALKESTVDLYNELVTKVFGEERAPTVDPSSAPENVSFLIAQKAGLDLNDRQRLLEEDSEQARLRMLQTHIEFILPRVDLMQEVERIVRNNGYV